MPIDRIAPKVTQGQGAKLPIHPAPLTLKRQWQAIINDPGKVAGPPWRPDFHGRYESPRFRMGKILKVWGNGIVMAFCSLMVLPA